MQRGKQLTDPLAQIKTKEREIEREGEGERDRDRDTYLERDREGGWSTVFLSPTHQKGAIEEKLLHENHKAASRKLLQDDNDS